MKNPLHILFGYWCLHTVPWNKSLVRPYHSQPCSLQYIPIPCLYQLPVTGRHFWMNWSATDFSKLYQETDDLSVIYTWSVSLDNLELLLALLVPKMSLNALVCCLVCFLCLSPLSLVFVLSQSVCVCVCLHISLFVLLKTIISLPFTLKAVKIHCKKCIWKLQPNFFFQLLLHQKKIQNKSAGKVCKLSRINFFGWMLLLPKQNYKGKRRKGSTVGIKKFWKCGW